MRFCGGADPHRRFEFTMLNSSRKSPETPKTLDDAGDRLIAAGASLKKTAEKMRIKGIHVIPILHGRGTHEAIARTIEKFAGQAKFLVDLAKPAIGPLPPDPPVTR